MARLIVHLVNAAAGSTQAEGAPLRRVSAQAAFFADTAAVRDGEPTRALTSGVPDEEGLVALELANLFQEREVVVLALLDGMSTLGQVSIAGTAVPNEQPVEREVRESS